MIEYKQERMSCSFCVSAVTKVARVMALYGLLVSGGTLSEASAEVRAGPQDATSGASASVARTAAMTDAEVIKVDMANRRITLKHAEIETLGMGAMTMVFKVSEPAALNGLKPGDKVRFDADIRDGALTATRIERVK